MAILAYVLLGEGQFKQARELAASALAIAPTDPQVMNLAKMLFTHGMPDWHFKIVHDEARNAAYDGALRRALHPGAQVLEIGAGTGLLAMMAARAGARRVVTCEGNPPVADVASKIVANNGFADRIRVVAKRSQDLKLGVDLEEPADILVSEIVSSNMIGEGVLLAIEEVAVLLRPGARVIPARGALRVALAEDRESERMRMGVIDGFDLSAFNHLAPAVYKIRIGSPRLSLRSEAADLFKFDFQSLGPFPSDETAISMETSGGIVGGVAQWIRLDMDAEGSYENAPSGGARSGWAAQFFPLEEPIELQAGAKVIVHGAHDRLGLRIWAEVPFSAKSVPGNRRSL